MTGKPELDNFVLMKDIKCPKASIVGGSTFDGPINLAVRRGEFVSLLGPGDCGKGTLIKMIAGLCPAEAGEIWIAGRKVDGPQHNLGIIFRNPTLLPWRTLLQNVLFQAEMRELDLQHSLLRARRFLGILGLSRSEHCYPAQLLPHEIQRAAICRALVHDPPLLLMDDLFCLLDPLAREQLALDLQRLPANPDLTTILTTSQMTEAVQLSDRVVVFSSRGSILHTIAIDLPRPRRLDKETTPRIGQYCSDIRTLFHAQGVLS